MKRFSHRQFRLEDLVESKGSSTISACVPALNEAPTIGGVVSSLVGLKEAGLLDEVLVIDSGSTDRTREIAASAGAEVVVDYEILPALGPAQGKGEAIFKGTAVATGQIICWLDADVTNFSDRFVLGLVGPLLCDQSLCFVKGFYERPLSQGKGSPPTDPVDTPASATANLAPGSAGGWDSIAGSTLDASASGRKTMIGEGGRVTELTARPLLAHFFPELAVVSQPLSGEYAARRWVFEQISLDTGYGVDVGILIDVFLMVGAEQMAECDLEIRHHRNRPLKELGPMAAEVSYAILRRVPEAAGSLAGYAGEADYSAVYGRDLRLLRRPPLAALRSGVEPPGA